MQPEPMYRQIGLAIRKRRRQLEMAQDDLARQLGLSRATIANLETGRQRLLVHQLYAVAKALRVRPGDLLPRSLDETSTERWSSIPIEGDLNPDQRRQIARLIGSVNDAQQSKRSEDGKQTRNAGSQGAKIARRV